MSSKGTWTTGTMRMMKVSQTKALSSCTLTSSTTNSANFSVKESCQWCRSAGDPYKGAISTLKPVKPTGPSEHHSTLLMYLYSQMNASISDQTTSEWSRINSAMHTDYGTPRYLILVY